MHSTVVVVAVTILAIIAYGDVRFRRIPNGLSLAVAALGVGRLVFAHNPAATGYTFATATLTFAVTFYLSWRDAIGGGDAKVITAMALLIGYRQWLNFLFLMSVSGGLLALAILARNAANPALDRIWRLTGKQRRAATGPSLPAAERTTVPYGVAVAAAGALSLMMAR
jgi:prepilin peptidase CpaA